MRTRPWIVSGGMVIGVFVAGALAAQPGNPQRYLYTAPIQTGDGWRTTSLSAKGMDVRHFVRLMNRIEETESHLIHSILVVKDAALVFQIVYWR